MIISKVIKIKVNGQKIKRYSELGYDISSEFINVKVDDLPKGSHYKIIAKCHYCSVEKSVTYKRYNESINKGFFFSCSIKCGRLKSKETCLKKYGVENVSQTDDHKEKCEKTCLDKYGSIHYNKTNEYKEKNKNTNLDKYGVEHYSQTDEYWIRVKQTNLDKYGVEHYSQTDEYKEKFKNTNLERYGVDSYTKTDEFKEKYKNTCLDKYGVDSYTKTDEFKEKYKNTCLDKYGVGNTFQSKKIKDKIKETNLVKYGTDYYSQTIEFIQKSKDTSLYKYGVDNYAKTYECKVKVKKTNLDKYGVDSYSKTDECKEKSKEICLDKYGVDNYSKTDECKIKIKETNLDKYGVENYTQSEKYHANTKIGNNINYIKYLDNGISLFNCFKGHTFEIYSDNYYNRLKSNVSLCTVCNPIGEQKSIKEKDLLEFIQNNYYGEIISGYRDGIEIDIYLPELNLGFEFNGLYWHSNKFKEKNYHLDKTNHFKEKGIRIIHIYEDDWTFKKEIVKSQISNLLGYSNKIFARKCIIKEVDTKIARKFLDDNHIQGFVKSSIKIGLYYSVTQSNGVTNEVLVSIMTFDSFEGRKKMEEGGYNLSRFCNKININVVGGASKLLNYFIKTYNPSRIISYADKDWSIGQLYYTLGFTNVGGNGPDYKYIVDNKRVHKSRYKKSKLKTTLTESKTMEELGINKIYDCGKIKFEYKKRAS